ncbi:hypothetical protein QBC39DRAFT_375357 [Podospora conica]|nr:hypothetical protein QBC39DRAFT_375357 [Schizothecium conicum]
MDDFPPSWSPLAPVSVPQPPAITQLERSKRIYSAIVDHNSDATPLAHILDAQPDRDQAVADLVAHAPKFAALVFAESLDMSPATRDLQKRELDHQKRLAILDKLWGGRAAWFRPSSLWRHGRDPVPVPSVVIARLMHTMTHICTQHDRPLDSLFTPSGPIGRRLSPAEDQGHLTEQLLRDACHELYAQTGPWSPTQGNMQKKKTEKRKPSGHVERGGHDPSPVQESDDDSFVDMWGSASESPAPESGHGDQDHAQLPMDAGCETEDPSFCTFPTILQHPPPSPEGFNSPAAHTTMQRGHVAQSPNKKETAVSSFDPPAQTERRNRNDAAGIIQMLKEAVFRVQDAERRYWNLDQFCDHLHEQLRALGPTPQLPCSQDKMEKRCRLLTQCLMTFGAPLEDGSEELLRNQVQGLVDHVQKTAGAQRGGRSSQMHDHALGRLALVVLTKKATDEMDKSSKFLAEMHATTTRLRGIFQESP